MIYIYNVVSFDHKFEFETGLYEVFLVLNVVFFGTLWFCSTGIYLGHESDTWTARVRFGEAEPTPPVTRRPPSQVVLICIELCNCVLLGIPVRLMFVGLLWDGIYVS